MKKLLLSSLAVAALLLAASLSAQAQDNKSLLIGPGSSNWFIGIGGGVNSMYDNKAFSIPNNPAVSAYVGKWFTPAIGFRGGYLGLQNSPADPKGWFSADNPFSYNLAYLDAMWNIASTAKYKQNRVWNPILYVRSGGIFAGYDGATRKNLAVGGGLMNQFRVSNRVSLAIDLSAVTSAERRYRDHGRFTTALSGTAGLVIDLGKRGFQRPETPKPDTRAIDDLRNQLNAANSKAADAERNASALAARVSQYENMLQGLRNGETYKYENNRFSPATVEQVIAVPEILYFDLGKATLTGRELARLEYYAENTFKKDQKLLVTGCADLGTGTREANDRLSNQRAEYVKNILVNQFGYNAANIETKADVMPGDAPIKGRIVTIEVK